MREGKVFGPCKGTSFLIKICILIPRWPASNQSVSSHLTNEQHEF
jgi:hypothetical protein